MIDWIDGEAMAKATRNMRGWSSRAIDRKAKHGQIVWRPSRQCGQGGRPPREYFVPSLPDKVQQLIRDVQPAVEAALACRPSEPSSLEPASQQVRLPVDSAARTQGEERYGIIRSFLDFCQHPQNQKPQPIEVDGRMIRTHDDMAIAVAKRWNVSPKTVWRWARLYKKQGLPGLLDKACRSDRGKSRFFNKYPKAAAVAATLYLDQRRLGVRSIHRILLENRTALGIPVEELPSYETARAWLNDKDREMRIGEFVVTPAMRIMAREGLRQYENRVAPFVKRAYVDVAANQVWCSDGKICDVEVWNDCFPEVQFGAPLRLRFTGIECFRSRKLVGWSFSPVESSVSIATAMRGPLLQFGPCEIFYVDNGKAYRKIGAGAEPANPREEQEGELPTFSEAELGLLARLGIRVQYCQPYHGQSKPIERLWKTMKEQFEIHFPTYTGGKPELRPDETSVEMARHRKLLRMGQAYLRHSNHPPATAFIAMCAAWIEQYNNTTHAGEGMNGRTPNEVFAAEMNPAQRLPLTLPEIALSLAERKPRKVHECAIDLGRRRYIGVDDTAAIVLHDLAEQDVVIAYDPNDPSGIAVLDLYGKLLCWAKPEEKLPQSPAAAKAVAASVSQRKRLKKNTLDQIATMKRLAAQTGVQSPLEALAEKARVRPIAVGEFMTHRAPRMRPDNTAVAPPSPAESARILAAMEEEESLGVLKLGASI